MKPVKNKMVYEISHSFQLSWNPKNPGLSVVITSQDDPFVGHHVIDFFDLVEDLFYCIADERAIGKKESKIANRYAKLFKDLSEEIRDRLTAATEQTPAELQKEKK